MKFQYNKNQLLGEINQIRKEIGHEEVDIKIKDIIHNENTNELWIIGEDRPDKSAIIGKGGWVVGKLREKLNLNSIHVESYGDFLLKEYRSKLSLNRITKFIKELESNNKDEEENNEELLIPMKNLQSMLKNKIENIYSFNFKEHFNNNSYTEAKSPQVILALSGGSDSSFSLILAKKLGFNPIAITVDPGTIVLPKQFKENIDNLTNQLNVKQTYVSVDYSKIIKDAFDGRIHPCGKCSKVIENTVNEYAIKNNISLVIYGDMLATGSQCITEQNINEDTLKEIELKKSKLYRLNLPASLCVEKIENKQLNSDYELKEIKGFGCPLLYETHKRFHHMKKYSIQRILRETRSGALEPGEALDLIWSFYNA